MNSIFFVVIFKFFCSTCRVNFHKTPLFLFYYLFHSNRLTIFFDNPKKYSGPIIFRSNEIIFDNFGSLFFIIHCIDSFLVCDALRLFQNSSIIIDWSKNPVHLAPIIHVILTTSSRSKDTDSCVLLKSSSKKMKNAFLALFFL